MTKSKKATKNKKMTAKQTAIFKMVEALIQEDAEQAAIHLHDYLQTKTRELFLNEKEDESDDKEKDEDKDDKSDDEDDDDSDDKEKDEDKDDKIDKDDKSKEK